MTLTVQTKETQIKNIHNTFTLLIMLSKRWFMQRLQVHSLTMPQFVTLAVLAAHREPCTMSDLTNVTVQDPPTTTGIIDRLVKTNLVRRTRSQTDRRVVLVEATQTGIDLIEEIEANLTREATKCYASLSEDELDALEQVIRRLLQIHLGERMLQPVADLDAEIERLEHYVKDPLYYTKLEREKALQ